VNAFMGIGLGYVMHGLRRADGGNNCRPYRDCSVVVFVAQSFQTDEKNDFPLLGRQLRQGSELVQLMRGGRIRDGRQCGGDFVDIDCAGIAISPPHIVDMLVVHQGEEPGAHCRAPKRSDIAFSPLTSPPSGKHCPRFVQQPFRVKSCNVC
jgi:hypothetical protein